MIPQKIHEIETQCFNGCQELTDVVLHDDIKRIGTMAFCGAGINSIVLPAKLEELEPMAFGFTPLNKITSNSGNFVVKDGVIYNKDMTILVQYYGTAKSFKIPYGVKKVMSCAFAFRYIEEEISFPETVESIGHRIFEQVSAPKRIVIPAKLKEQMSNAIESYYQDRIVTI